ncbi:ComF family protein [Bacillus alveayuensis]|uniref:ComF family protein n=1 Tax=Aeribacillus alveayuensis TaxID=279215 RepID=UPI0005D0F2EE|nr:ComF family protein [Bacillus alveayuensis]
MTKCLYCFADMEPCMSWRTIFSLLPQELVCDECRQKFVLIEGPVCSICGRPGIHDHLCEDCHRWEQQEGFQGVLLKNRSVYLYNDFMKEVLSRFKFRGDAILSEIFRTSLQDARKRYFPQHDFLLLPIPLSQKRLYERGFNQAKLLAQLLDLPIIEPLTKLDSEKQSKKSRIERISIANMFSLKNSHEVKERHIIIIDDLYTTGTTIRHAAKLLKEAGAKSIQSLTLIRS